jgi:hypothetical protein
MHGEPVAVGEHVVTPQAEVDVRGKVVNPREHVREVHWWKYVGVALQADMKHDKMVDQMVGAGMHKAKAVALGNYLSFARGLTPVVQLAVVRGISKGDGRGVLSAPCEGNWLLQQEQYFVQTRASAGGFARFGTKDVCHFEGGGSAKCPCGNGKCMGEKTAAYFLFGCPSTECLRGPFYTLAPRRLGKFRTSEVAINYMTAMRCLMGAHEYVRQCSIPG